MESWGKAFSFMFEDKAWPRKILIGGLFTVLSIFIIGFFFVLGYGLILMRNSYEGRELPLPEWDDLGNKCAQGAVAFVILLIYMLPAMILMALSVLQIGLGHDTGSMFSCCFNLLGTFWTFALAYVSPYILMRYALSGEAKDAFDIEGLIRFVRNHATELLMVLAMTVALQTLALVGLLALCVGVFFTMFWALLGTAWLCGKVYKQADGGGAPTKKSILPRGA
jgi:hypothetical protein